MKRFWIGICVLCLLLFGSWMAANYIERSYDPIGNELAQAVLAVQQGNWQQAEARISQAQQQWLVCRELTAIFCDHTILEEVESLFAEIRVYAANQEQVAFSTACGRLAVLAQAIAQSHSLMWQNFL